MPATATTTAVVDTRIARSATSEAGSDRLPLSGTASAVTALLPSPDGGDW